MLCSGGPVPPKLSKLYFKTDIANQKNHVILSKAKEPMPFLDEMSKGF
jgi:hypothetical protein